MRLLLIGPPASGKGTQAARIADQYHLPHVESGELLRQEVEARTEIGRRIQPYLEQGDLVPDDIVLDVVGTTLGKAAVSGGFLLDGFPRNVDQAKELDVLTAPQGASVQLVIVLDADQEHLLERMRERAAVGGRADDTEETIRHRLAVYEEQTVPLTEYYEGRAMVRHIDGRPPIDEVTAAITATVDDLKGSLDDDRP
ncbi:MAG: adenylate kinase [Acidimicrobiales bacterium]